MDGNYLEKPMVDSDDHALYVNLTPTHTLTI